MMKSFLSLFVIFLAYPVLVSSHYKRIPQDDWHQSIKEHLAFGAENTLKDLLKNVLIEDCDGYNVWVLSVHKKKEGHYKYYKFQVIFDKDEENNENGGNDDQDSKYNDNNNHERYLKHTDDSSDNDSSDDENSDDDSSDDDHTDDSSDHDHNNDGHEHRDFDKYKKEHGSNCQYNSENDRFTVIYIVGYDSKTRKQWLENYSCIN